MSFFSHLHENIGLRSKEDLLKDLISEMLASFNEISVTQLHITLIDIYGNIQYLDKALDEFLYLIRNYCIANFQNLEEGDCKIPFGGINLGFFKISRHLMLIVYAPDSPSGQLLGLKKKLGEWGSKLEDLLGEFSPPESVESKQVKEDNQTNAPDKLMKTENIAYHSYGVECYPLLLKPLTEKEKFTMEEIQILQFCDGMHSTDEIHRETYYSISRINKIIRKFEEKGWLKVDRVRK
ncbi:MAG: hypothetical protein ACTSRS_06495 [Candidatus Helarchaeota archaeon]